MYRLIPSSDGSFTLKPIDIVPAVVDIQTVDIVLWEFERNKSFPRSRTELNIFLHNLLNYFNTNLIAMTYSNNKIIIKKYI